MDVMYGRQAIFWTAPTPAALMQAGVLSVTVHYNASKDALSVGLACLLSLRNASP